MRHQFESNEQTLKYNIDQILKDKSHENQCLVDVLGEKEKEVDKLEKLVMEKESEIRNLAALLSDKKEAYEML